MVGALQRGWGHLKALGSVGTKASTSNPFGPEQTGSMDVSPEVKIVISMHVCSP